MVSLAQYEETKRQAISAKTSDRLLLAHFVDLLNVEWRGIAQPERTEILLNGFKTLRQLTQDPQHAEQLYI